LFADLVGDKPRSGKTEGVTANAPH
jgi:hypothetical protein